MKKGAAKSSLDQGAFGPSMLDDPYGRYRQLRESNPVFWDPVLKAWLVTRYDDVAFVLKDQRFSSNRTGAAIEQLKTDRYCSLLTIMSNKMSEKDEPAHSRLRSLINQAFTHVAVEHWEPIIRQRVTTLLNGFKPSGRCEFIDQYAVPLPLMTIMQLMGIPTQETKQVKLWCDHFAMIALNFYTHLNSDQLEQGLSSIREFGEFLERRIAELKTEPGNHLLDALIQAEHEGDKLSLDELLANCFLLLSAGNETTTSLLGNSVLALLKHPEQMQRLRAAPELIPLAVEEFLRFDSPVQYLGRIASEDIEVGSKMIREGQLVLAVLAAANRDPEYFPQPDKLDVGRQDNHHLAFGHGRHFCVGSQFAKLEARATFEALVERTDQLQLDGIDWSDLQYHENFNIRCLKRLPLQIDFAC